RTCRPGRIFDGAIETGKFLITGMAPFADRGRMNWNGNSMTILRFTAVLALLCWAGWSPAALAQIAAPGAARAPVPAASVAAAAPAQAYRRGTGDKVRVTVFGEPERRGEY